MAKFEMDTEFIRKLAKLLEETNLGEIEMAEGDRRMASDRLCPRQTSSRTWCVEAENKGLGQASATVAKASCNGTPDCSNMERQRVQMAMLALVTKGAITGDCICRRAKRHCQLGRRRY